jgi:hypothetical protein
MSDPLRENGPIVLVPAAWTVAGAAHAGVVSGRTFLIAHAVMAAVLFVFPVVSWNEMKEGVLRVWRTVLVVGFFITVSGAAGLYGVHGEEILLGVSLYGWMLLPAAGLAYTARESDAPHASAFGAALSLVGAALYAVGVTASVIGVPHAALLAIAVVGIGQTVGIADAVYRY